MARTLHAAGRRRSRLMLCACAYLLIEKCAVIIKLLYRFLALGRVYVIMFRVSRGFQN